MMKKMLVLALVLAVAGLANAGLSLAPMSNVSGSIFKVTVLGTGTPDETWLSITGGTFDFGSAVFGPAAGAAGAFVFDQAYAPEYLYMKNVAVPAPGSWTDGTLFTVNVNGAGARITLYGPDGVNAIPGYADVPVVPEPMTMVLLGLGGLFLRKMK